MNKQEKINKKRGNKIGFWFFRTAMKLSGLRGAYGLLYFVCLYYLIFDRTAVSASMAYVQRRFRSYNRFRRIYAVYRLFVSQGKSLVDRYYVVSGLGEFDIELRGYDKIKDFLSASPKGVILVTAHVGNWQVAMTALKKFGKMVYLLMSPEENAAVKDTLALQKDMEMIRIISIENFLGGVIEIMKVIDEGHLVSIMGDRSDGYPSVKVDFLGEKASFPYGAFSIAAAAQCPVVVLLSAKTAARKYMVDVSHVITPRYRNRNKKQDDISTWVQEFAGIMEEYAEKYPFQWFVFRDMWKEKDPKNADIAQADN